MEFQFESIYIIFILYWTRSIDSFSLNQVQSVAIEGRLLCGGLPFPDVELALFDEDFPDYDDILDFGHTSENGSFLLQGYEVEMTKIDPALLIKHKCNDGGMPCDRSWRIKIPEKYITIGSEQPRNVMDLGSIETEVILENEERICDSQKYLYSLRRFL